MSYSTNIVDYPRLQNPDTIPDISGRNADHLRRFIARQRLDGVKLSSISITVTRVVGWIRAVGKEDVIEWQAVDIETEYLHRLDMITTGQKKPTTLDGELRAIKVFWKFLGKPPLNIRRRPTQLNLMSSDIVSREQIISMRNCAEQAGDIRGVALIMTLFGTGCRLSELCDANVRDVEITDQYANLKVSGKTGSRTVPFVIGLPELQTWLNCHPCRKSGAVDPDAPLFVTYATRGHTNSRLSTESVEANLRKWKKAAGIPVHVRCYPHALRHRSATQDSRNLTWKELCLKFGWSAYSDMPKRYTHTDQDELKYSVLSASGVELPEQVTETPLIIQCPRCHAINRADALYCDKCSLPLDESFAADLQKLTAALAEWRRQRYNTSIKSDSE